MTRFILAAILLLPTFAMAQTTTPDAQENAQLKQTTAAVYAATVDYRRHLSDLLNPPKGKDQFSDFQSGLVELTVDAVAVEGSPVMADEKAKPSVRELLDLRDPLITACDSWQSQNELDRAAVDATLPATTRNTMRRAAVRSEAARALIVQGVRERFDKIRERALLAGVKEDK